MKRDQLVFYCVKGYILIRQRITQGKVLDTFLGVQENSKFKELKNLLDTKECK